MTAVQNILLIKNTQGTKQKEALLKMMENHKETKELLYYAFNPYLTFGINNLTLDNAYHLDDDKHQPFINLLEHLANKNVNNTDTRFTKYFLENLSKETQEVYKDILTKSLSIGVAAKTLNKVWKDFIPTFECMLAEPAELLQGPWLVQEKLDGVRCIAIKKEGVVKFYTRQGNTIPLQNLKEKIEAHPADNFVLDGELLMQGALRQKTSGKINSLLKTGYQKEIDENIEFYVFDFLILEEWVSKQSLLTAFQRAGEVSGIVDQIGKPLQQVKQTLTDQEEGIKSFYNEIRKAGGEGVIVKTDSPYEWKRSKAWGKLKAICSATLKIVGFTEGEGKNEGKVGAVMCQSYDGRVLVKVNPRTDADREWFTHYQNVVLGLNVEVLFNELIQDEKGHYSLFLPRFASHWERFDKAVADTFDEIVKEVQTNAKSC